MRPTLNVRGNMGDRQTYGPFLGTLNMRCRTIIGIQNGPVIFDNNPQ